MIAPPYWLRTGSASVESFSKQTQTAKVKQECTLCLNIVLSIDQDPSLKAEVLSRVPVLSTTKDTDGIFLEILIHVVNGYLDKIEMWRGNLGPTKAYPAHSSADTFFS